DVRQRDRLVGAPAAGVGHTHRALANAVDEVAERAALAERRHPRLDVITLCRLHADGVFEPFPGHRIADFVAAAGVSRPTISTASEGRYSLALRTTPDPLQALHTFSACLM